MAMYSSKGGVKTPGRRTSSFKSTPPKKGGSRGSSAGQGAPTTTTKGGLRMIGMLPADKASMSKGGMKIMGSALGPFRSMGAANKPKVTNNYVMKRGR